MNDEKEIIRNFCELNNKEKRVEMGSVILIIEMKEENNYSGKYGKVLHVDDIGQIHGTWGGCALIPGVDIYLII